MRSISFDEADHHLTWTSIADALANGHTLEKAEIGDLLLQSAPNAMLNRAAWINGMGFLMKSMSVFPGNKDKPTIQGGVMLFDDVDGSLKAIIDGILVTKWKTAGDSVLGARLLANPSPKTHLMIGAGTVASSILEAYSEIFPTIDRFLIWNRSPDRALALQATKTKLGMNVEVVEDLESACAQADIITSATMSVEPFLQGSWIKPGTHIDLIGAYKPNMREATDELLLKSEIFVDSRETTFGHIGEIEIPFRNGTISKQDVLGDFYDLQAGKVGRGNKESITLFKNGGGAHLDLMTASHICAQTP